MTILRLPVSAANFRQSAQHHGPPTGLPHHNYFRAVTPLLVAVDALRGPHPHSQHCAGPAITGHSFHRLTWFDTGLRKGTIAAAGERRFRSISQRGGRRRHYSARPAHVLAANYSAPAPTHPLPAGHVITSSRDITATGDWGMASCRCRVLQMTRGRVRFSRSSAQEPESNALTNCFGLKDFGSAMLLINMVGTTCVNAYFQTRHIGMYVYMYTDTRSIS